MFSFSDDVLELGAEVSILSEDFKSFEKFYKQLQPYYDPLLTNTSALYSSEQATQSRNLMTGLYLMYLFTTFQFGDFEKEHESLDDKRKDNVFVDYVIRLRRDMEEKAYFQVRTISSKFLYIAALMTHYYILLVW